MTIYDNLLLTNDNRTQIKPYFAINNREEHKMNYFNTFTKSLLFFIIIVLTTNTFFAQNSKLINDNKMEDIIANYQHSLNSENDGVRMAVVEYVGRYKISHFEDKLIELLREEQETQHKEIIALSLFQLGSLRSISELKNSLTSSKDLEFRGFCKCLIEKYGEYDKLRSEYFETLVVNLLETE